MFPKIWLIGDRGMLGTELSLLFEERGLPFVGSDREVDIRDAGALGSFAREAFPSGGPEWIVNCSAYTAVDKAEEEEALAREINALGAGLVARVAHERGAALIHVSTDYVFDGQGIRGPNGELRPYLESDEARPAGAYGRTKLEGEELVRAACPRHFIVRTAWLYGAHGPNFVYTMLRLMRQRESIGVVADQWGSPTWARDLARLIVFIIESGVQAYGTYHYSNAGVTNWHGFASSIHRLGRDHGLIERPCEIRAITSAEYPSKVKRPAWSVLSKEKIAAIGAEVPAWEESLEAFMQQAFRLWDDFVNYAKMASYDLETARAMLDAGRYLYVAYSCQQAVEKCLKARISNWATPRRSHDLLLLMDQARLDPGKWAIALVDLTRYYLKGRYPEDFDALTRSIGPERAETMLREAESLCATLRTHPSFSLL